MRPEIQEGWIDYFRVSGFPEARGLSVGMEGAVYMLAEGELVAKVWLSQTRAELERLKAFYDRLAEAAGPLATPRIHEIRVVDGVLVSLERYLPGTSLGTCLQQDASHADELGMSALISVLQVLGAVAPHPEFRQLATLGEQVSPWAQASSWSSALEGLIDRRMARFGGHLERSVPDVDRVRDAVGKFLKSRDDQPMSLIHGDLCGANIIVDDQRRPLAVIDFGFLTTVGDPAFDASISGGIFNMYGLHARQIDDEVTRALSRALGHPLETLLAYRAAYGLLTSNAYSPDGSDGHFQWCVSMLRRDDVRSSLGL